MIKSSYLKGGVLLCSLFILLNSCAHKICDFEYDGLIHLNSNIENKFKSKFVYDTGAPFLYIDSSYLVKNKINFRYINEVFVSGIGNNLQKTIKVNDTVFYETCNNKNYSVNTSVLNLKNILGKNVDGILGVQTFNLKKHKINYIDKTISLINTNYKEIREYNTIKFKYINYKIIVPLSIVLDNELVLNGEFLLDTGSRNTVLTSKYSSNKLETIDYISLGGTGGVSEGKTAIIKKINFGGFELNNFRVDISTDSLGALSKNRFYDGIIGNDLLDDFDIIIDVKNNLLFLKRNKNFNKKRTSIIYKGFSVSDRTDLRGWIVNYLYYDSDAYLKGLRLNDLIVEINDVKVTKMNLNKFYKNLIPNQILKLKIIRENKEYEILCSLNNFFSIND